MEVSTNNNKNTDFPSSSSYYNDKSPPSLGESDSSTTTKEDLFNEYNGGTDDDLAGLSLSQKLLYHARSMIMEPGFLVYMIASSMGNIIASDLQLDRACRVNVGYNDTICDALMATPKVPGYTAEEQKVQSVIAGIGVWIEVIENFFPILFSLFLGGWTDIYGTKLPFLLTIAGVVVRYSGLLICTYYSHWTAETIGMFSILPTSLTGGRIAVSMVVYSYVAVTSSIQERTFRVGVLTAVRTFGRSAGSGLGGFLKRSKKDYYFIFGIGGGLGAISFIYILLLCPNPKKGSNPYNLRTDTKMDAVRNLFNVKNIIASAKSFFKPRPYGIRHQLYLLVLILIFTMAPMQGEDSVLILFVRNKIRWSTGEYANYSTFRMLIAFGGGLISVGLFVKLMKMIDWKLGLISCLSQIAGCFVYAFADETRRFMMYLAPVVDILNGTMIIAARSMISKISPVPEMGKINSIVAVIDATTPLWGNSVYNAVYQATLSSSLPGAFFLLSAALTIPPLVLFIYFGITKRGIPIEEQAARAEKKKLKNVS